MSPTSKHSAAAQRPSPPLADLHQASDVGPLQEQAPELVLAPALACSTHQISQVQAGGLELPEAAVAAMVALAPNSGTDPCSCGYLGYVTCKILSVLTVHVHPGNIMCCLAGDKPCLQHISCRTSPPVHFRLIPHAERLPAATALGQHASQRSQVTLLGLSHGAFATVVPAQRAAGSHHGMQLVSCACVVLGSMSTQEAAARSASF
jgi:hypothetical protein